MGGNEAVVQLLLKDPHIDISVKNKYGHTALMRANESIKGLLANESIKRLSIYKKRIQNLQKESDSLKEEKNKLEKESDSLKIELQEKNQNLQNKLEKESDSL